MKRTTFFTALWLALSMLVHASSLSLASSQAPASLIDRDQALAAAARVSPATYPDADTAIVDRHAWIRYQEDGTYVERDETYHKVLTQEGVESLRSLSSWFTIPYNTTRFERVEIIRPDGSVIPVDMQANAKVMIDRSQMSSNIYNPNDKILKLNLPDLKVGDLIHYTIEDIFSKVRTPGSFSKLIPFENTCPILHTTHTLIAPQSLPLANIAVRDRVGHTLTHTQKHTGDEIVYVWEGRDIPQAFREPDMPSWRTVTQRVLVSTIPDWEWISRWYWNLSEPHLTKVTEPMRNKVRELVDGLKDPREQIRSIFTWVSQEVRYLGLTLENNAPGYEPHSVDMTFDRRAGVCRDKAALLVAMLRLAGFEAYPVLIMSGPKKDPKVPQPSFNHAISCVRLQDGKGTIVLMDATDEHARSLFPPYLNNCSYLIASPQGDPLRTSPVIPAASNMLTVATTGKLSPSGELQAETLLTFKGINDSAYRGFFARSPKEKQRSYFEKALKSAYPGAELLTMTISPKNIMDTAEPLTVSLAFQVPHFLTGRQATRVLALPPLGRHLGVARMLIDKMGLTKRRYPLFTQYACGVDETVRLELGDSVGALLSAPEPITTHSQETTFLCDYHLEGTTLVARHLFSLNLPEYSPAQYLALKQNLGAQEINDQAVCVFAARKKADDVAAWYGSFQSDAVVIQDEVEWVVQDNEHWVGREHKRIKILTYAGKKEQSEINMDYTPAYEQVRIVNATVTGRDGSVKHLEPQEINRMDAPWVGEAPLYPAAKTLVAGLPGVELGSVIDYTLERVVHSQDGFTMQEIMSDACPILHKTVRVRLPQDMNIRIFTADQGYGLATTWVREPATMITQKRQVQDGLVTHTFTVHNVPPVKQENNQPPTYAFQPVVAITATTWPHLAKTLAERLEDAARQNTRTAKLAQELTAQAHTDYDKVRILRDYVARHIALQGPDADTYPQDKALGADTVMQAGYGCSADRAVVIYAMLKALGLQPAFVIAGNAPPVPALQDFMRMFASREWLDQVLVRVMVDGHTVYLNDTDEYAVLGSTSQQGRAGLELPGGEIRIISSEKALRDSLEADYAIHLEHNGDALITRKQTFRGTLYNIKHRQLAEMSPETMTRYQQRLTGEISLNAVMTSYTQDCTSYPGQETLGVTVNNLGIRQGKYLILDLPGMIRKIGGVTTRTRATPLCREQAKDVTVRIRVHLPQGTRSLLVQPAQNCFIPLGQAGALEVRTRVLPSRSSILAHVPPQTLEVELHAHSHPVVVSPDDYTLWCKAEDILATCARGTLVLDLP